MMADKAQPMAYIGQSLRRREDMKFVTGNGRYVDDIKLPGMLFWRSSVRRTRTLSSPA